MVRDLFSQHRHWTCSPVLRPLSASAMDVAPDQARRHRVRAGRVGCRRDICSVQVGARFAAAAGGMVDSVTTAGPVLAANWQAWLALSPADSTLFSGEARRDSRSDVRGHSRYGCGVYSDDLRLGQQSLQSKLQRQTALRSPRVSDTGSVYGESFLCRPLGRRSARLARRSPPVGSGPWGRRLGNRHCPREILGNASFGRVWCC